MVECDHVLERDLAAWFACVRRNQTQISSAHMSMPCNHEQMGMRASAAMHGMLMHHVFAHRKETAAKSTKGFSAAARGGSPQKCPAEMVCLRTPV